MTEAEWLEDLDGRVLLDLESRSSVRKMLLMAAAYVRRATLWPLAEEAKRCDDLIEAVADCPRPWSELQTELESRPGESWMFTHILYREDPDHVAKRLRHLAAFYPTAPSLHISDLVREVVGNPFRPIRLDPSWRTSDVLSLAHGIYAERAFDRLPILGDALEDAGCADRVILGHCRGAGPHVRGCWVVDLILGKP